MSGPCCPAVRGDQYRKVVTATRLLLHALVLTVSVGGSFSAYAQQQVSWKTWKQRTAVSSASQDADEQRSALPERSVPPSAELSDDATRDLQDFVAGSRKTRKQKPLSRSVSMTRVLPMEDDSASSQTVSSGESPPEPSPIWWGTSVQSQLRPGSRTVNVGLESLLVQALDHSSQIKVYSDLPMIRQTAVVEASAAFDPAAFLESRWDDQNDPVGNTLTTGGASRYKNNQMSTAAGLRKRTATGGKVEVSDRIGFQDTNSKFFSPNPQGTSKLVLNYTQPLMRGRGCEYNQSLTVLAEIDKEVAEDEFSRQLQSHLLEVTRSYWGLYLERALLSQKLRSLERAKNVHQLLLDRVSIDAVKPQVLRAEAEVATRCSDLIRAELAVQNAEARIRALVNDPSLGDSVSDVELIPVDGPSDIASDVDLSRSLATALQTRPEVTQAIKQIKAGCVRQEISRNELMPSLNLITETYLSGLQNNGSIGDAFTDQFHVGGPSYSVGLQFEVPLQNRAVKSRHERRRVELRQLQNQYQTTVHTLSLEVEVAVRELETSYSEMTSQKRAVEASAAQLDYLQKRWELLPGEDGTGALMLDNLLTAQERLVISENAYTQAWITYNLAIISHQRATGELLQSQDIAWGDYVNECEGVQTRLIHKSTEMDHSTLETQ